MFLFPVVCARKGRAGDVGCEDCEFRGVGGGGIVIVAFDEPDEAGAEHGVCGCEEGRTEGFYGAEGGGEFGG